MFRSILVSLALAVAALAAPRVEAQSCDYLETDEGGTPYCSFLVDITNNAGCSYYVWIVDYDLPTSCLMKAACWCDADQACNMSAAMDVDDSGPPITTNFVTLHWDCISSCGWYGEVRFWYENKPYQNCPCCDTCASPSYYMTAACD